MINIKEKEMEEIIKYISTQGLALFIVSFIIYFGAQFIKIYLDKLKRKNDVKHHDELIVLRRKIGKEIQTILQNMVLRTRGVRAYTFEFHNGTLSMGGLPFCKMSCTYEELDENAKSVINDRQDLSLSLYSTFIESLYENRCVVIDTTNRNDVHSTLEYETLIKRGVITTVRASISNKSNRVFGFIGVDYTTSQTDETITEAVRIVQDTAIKIGALLSIDE